LTTKKTVTFCQPIATYRFKLNVKPDGAVNVLSKTLESSSPACVGRQSAGVVRSANADADPRGKYFADCAQLERAAVIAFERLSRELEALGAPLELLRDAERARQDEVRHAATMEKLAAHFDTAVGEVRVEDVPLRNAFEVALENAVEGCVRESFAALVGLWQSERASTDLQQALREIAVDELRHAALSWRVARWLEPRLSDEERSQVERARKLAFNELSTATQDLSGALTRDLGVPNAAEAHELVQRLGAQLGLS
ncbi:MAG: hypothetical protein KC492_18165, partial [Myxococcales bacterium]|nr:hypothetical protein [Myxococcales bacterium]